LINLKIFHSNNIKLAKKRNRIIVIVQGN